ncbi:ParB N-terminal domain-containing protein [Nocardia sp. NPDC046763]|uniref:ParB/RepB/Spo0J family partition protein n=1 Tax=Nocardia sp. NPDC046763 TaxID=3155256 RepID=UPI0033CDBF09
MKSSDQPPVRRAAGSMSGAEVPFGGGEGEVVWAATATLLVGDHPRIGGVDAEHVKMLAESQARLPPILVHRPTMRVIDGVHRLRAAELRGDPRIEVVFFDGNESDAFVLAVRANIYHGLPLSSADRTAAALRLLQTHSQWSDRALSTVTGLAAKTIAALRTDSDGSVPQVAARLGRDGKVRPVDSAAGRTRASRLLAARPDASLREIANAAGISPATVRDVRARLDRGEAPVPERGRRTPKPVRVRDQTASELLSAMYRDPSLRLTGSGRTLLRLLSSPLLGERTREQLVMTVPPHCADLVAQIARECAAGWHKFADELAARPRTLVDGIHPAAIGEPQKN